MGQCPDILDGRTATTLRIGVSETKEQIQFILSLEGERPRLTEEA